jgi:hypothetical protein
MNLEFVDKVLFNKLNKYFGDNIRMSLKTPNKIFIITTKEDDFYEINIYDENIPSFVLCDNNQIIESMNVKYLSKKNIIDLSYGFCHYFARNDKNEIFCWGHNGCGQLGNGKRYGNMSLDSINALRHTSELFLISRYYGKQQNAPDLNKFLSRLNIEVIKCGFWHSLALTKNGEVFSWGFISTGKGVKKMCQLTPIKLDDFNGERVVDISCGYKHSLALTEGGRLFSWGENSYGQLGNRNEIFREKPKLIEIENVFIEKICSGQRHCLLLSNDGIIYAFGDNRFGQIGDGSNEIKTNPVKLNHKEKFIDIASNFMEDISVALSANNIFYVWGKCGKEIHLTPFKTTYRSFDEVFLNLTHIQYKPSKTLLEFNDLLFRYGYFETEFREIKEISGGSFGEVYRSIDKNDNQFAIKKIKPLPGLEKEFFREYINQFHVNLLKSKYFVKQYDSWFENNINVTEGRLSLYIQMELCDKTLEEVINEIKTEFFDRESCILSPIGFYLATEFFIEILRGVLCLHQHGIIHRDLKPTNILFRKEENGEINVKIADFGLSILHQFSEQSHSIDKGTPSYMAPEVITNKNYDTKADIYSLGIILEKLISIDTTKT